MGRARFVAIVMVCWDFSRAIAWAFAQGFSQAIAGVFPRLLPGLLPGILPGLFKRNWNWPSNRMQYWNGSISISASSANHSLASQNLFPIAQLSYSVVPEDPNEAEVLYISTYILLYKE